MRPTIGLMMNARSQARKNVRKMSPKKKNACGERGRRRRRTGRRRRARAARRPAGRLRSPGRPLEHDRQRRPIFSRTSSIVACGLRPQPVGARLEDPVDLVRVGQQLQVALAGRGVAGDDPVRQQLLGIDAAGPGGPLAVLDLLPVRAEEAVELADVAHLGAARVGPQDPLRVRDHGHDLLADHRRIGEHLDRVAERLAHLLARRRSRGPSGASVNTACGSGNVSP